MKKVLILVVVFIISMNLVSMGSGDELNIIKENVLIIHSYHQDFLWTKSFHEAIVKDSADLGWNIYVEYLDTYRLDASQSASKAQRIIEDYADKSLDAIVVTDNDALDFMLEVHETWFKDIPVFFGGINNMEAYSLDQDLYAGISQNTDLSSFYTTLFELFPRTEQLLVVGADSNTSHKIYEELVDLSLFEDKQIQINYVLDNDLRGQMTTLENANLANTVIYIAGSLGMLNHDEYASVIDDHVDVPIFVGVSISVVEDVLGGYVVNPQQHGAYIQAILNEYFMGQSISEIGISLAPLQQILFNYSALEKYDIPMKALPNDAIIINEPDTRVTVDKNVFRWIISSLIFTTLVIGLLLYILRSRHRYTKQIIKAQQELQETHMELEAHAEELVASQETLEYQFTELQDSKNRIQNLLNYDEKTGFLNVSPFVDQIHSSMEEGRQFHVVYITILNLERISYSLNHSMTDIIIQIIAGKIRDLLGSDGYCYGIDKGRNYFVLSHLEMQDLIERLEALNEMFATPIHTAYYKAYVNIKIGVASYPKDTKNPHDLLRFAGIAAAFNYSKRGEFMAFYSSEMAQSVLDFQKRIVEIEEAIEQKSFIIYLQPKYDSETFKIVGFEALVRWKLPDGKIRYPDEFIELAETTGQITGITSIVLERVALFMNRYRLYEAGLHVSVNLSSVDLKNHKIVNKINQVMDDYLVPHSCIELELTETGLLENFDTTVNILKSLRQEGYSVSLDDFGTGYSSLSYINRLPIDKIKLDRSFIQDIDNEQHMKVVVAIINLAHEMDYKVTIEGVENEVHVQLLAPYHAEEYQGYYFSKPMDIDAIIEMVKENLGLDI